MSDFNLHDALDRAAAEPDSRRAALLRSAEILFAERGFEGVTVRDIADASGVNVATLHLHWKTKATLYEAVCRQHAREFMAFFARTESDAADQGLPLADRLSQWVDATVELFTQRPPIAPLALQSLKDQAPSDIPSLFLHDVSLFHEIEARLRKAMPADEQPVEPILAVLSVFYFGILAFSDSPLQRALLGGSVYQDAEVRARVSGFARTLISRLMRLE